MPSPTPLNRPLSSARALGVVVLLAGLIAAGCASQESTTSAVPNGLLALTGSGDSTVLTAWDADRAKGTLVDLPDGVTTWISAGRARVLVATMIRGTTATSRPLDLGNDTTWRTVKPKDATGDDPAGPYAFATWDPDGGRYAVLGGDLLSDDPIAVVLIDPSVSTAYDIPLGRDVVAAPPVWIDDDRLVVVTQTSGTHRASFLGHPATGRRFRASGMDLLGFRDGLIASRQAVFDTVTMLRQLGLYR